MFHLTRLLIILLLLPLATTYAAEPRPPQAAIASAHPLATGAGHEILARGGNAFDAAVAVAAALAVVEPWNSGLGGGGFFLLHRARDGFETMIDARERAPLTATRDMYLRDGRPVPALSIDGALAAGIPGTPAGLAHLAKKYGKLGLDQSLAPAIRLARDGFPATPAYSKILLRQHMRLTDQFPETARAYLKEELIPAPGDIAKQPELAQTLERLAQKGQAGFYAGVTAERLVQGVRAAGGIWSMKDLAEYRVIERAPVRGTYRGVRVTSASLPSSGGVVLVQMLNLLQGFDLDSMPKAQRDHTVIEAMRLAYRDRARHLGDPDFVRVDAARLLDPAYIAKLRDEMRRPEPASVGPPAKAAGGGANTTHFSIIDREGNRVAATLSLNTPFGSGFMPPGTGVVLNNEMDDFAVKPDAPNTYGLVGGEANAIAPGKRPLSSMTPTFLETDDAIVVLGTPGGSRIISMVLLATLEFAHGHGGPKEWMSLPRFHHQYLPDAVTHEAHAFDAGEMRALQGFGHRLDAVRGSYGNMQLVSWYKKTGRLEAASDPRGEGGAQVK
ncbi:gamma-glutamyltransferase [Sulfuricaulis limicola]|uniref:Glutathione hydrolase proenzyme n=1 Tax=Sulfuricaulis limicola TaxID=1620215 RepID=A0A1B4XDR9_9GAMM|nr:gamma-glutamyltransferase [Sulfuricaulis limicola]BAV32949.1 gamma-glutamyltransferase [Sulfuricaulis limicola]